MLVQFSVKNYKTFKDKAVLSLIASNYDKDTRESENIFVNEKYNLRLLKNATVYGPNASGKTKLFESMSAMRTFVQKSYENSLKDAPIPVEPFRLNTQSETEPSEFEVVFLFKNVLYRYGFEANKTRVISEWLYYRPNSKETELFFRENENIEYNKAKFPKGELIKKEKVLRQNVLLLSVAASLNDKVANSIVDWFKTFNVISGIEEDRYQPFTMSRISKNEEKSEILNFIKSADLGINDISLKTTTIEEIPSGVPKVIRDRIIKLIKDKGSENVISDILTFHKKYDEDKNYIENTPFTLDDEESSGTQKFFSLSGPILDCLQCGDILVIDELDSKLHPNLVSEIISLFNSAERNPNNAQLIINTHNTNLLSKKLIRRDQVWFTRKNRMGEAILYSLADFKSDQVRKEEAFEDNYIKGKYGAIPYLDAFEDLNIHKIRTDEDEE